MKLYLAAILAGMASAPAAQIVSYILRIRNCSVTGLIIAAVIGIAIGVFVARAIAGRGELLDAVGVDPAAEGK
jgi:hypothetical protein